MEHNINTNNVSTEKDKWNFIKEARNANRTAITKSCLKTCFGDLVTHDSSELLKSLVVVSFIQVRTDIRSLRF